MSCFRNHRVSLTTVYVSRYSVVKGTVCVWGSSRRTSTEPKWWNRPQKCVSATETNSYFTVSSARFFQKQPFPLWRTHGGKERWGKCVTSPIIFLHLWLEKVQHSSSHSDVKSLKLNKMRSGAEEKLHCSVWIQIIKRSIIAAPPPQAVVASYTSMNRPCSPRLGGSHLYIHDSTQSERAHTHTHTNTPCVCEAAPSPAVKQVPWYDSLSPNACCHTHRHTQTSTCTHIRMHVFKDRAVKQRWQVSGSMPSSANVALIAIPPLFGSSVTPTWGPYGPQDGVISCPLEDHGKKRTTKWGSPQVRYLN